MTRIQLALDMTPRELAHVFGLPYSAMVDRHGSRADMSAFHLDPFWQMLLDYVDVQLAGFLAIKDELERKKRLDELERTERVRQVTERQ